MSMDIKQYIDAIGTQAKTAATELASATSKQKNAALQAIADTLIARQQWLQQENAKDLQAGKEKGLAAAMLDRLALDKNRIAAMAEGLDRKSVV